MRAALVALLACARPAGAQHVQTQGEYAVPVPAGVVRLHVAPSWARYDSRFTGDGGATAPLGAVFTSPALGTAALPALTRFENALRELTGDPAFHVSLGRSAAFSSVRVVTTPISLEYGVTGRLSLGVTVPIVQRQREMIIDLEAVDGDGAPAGNVGPTPARADPQVYLVAGRIAQEVAAATAQLSQRITDCAAQPAGAGCAAITADPSGAAATVTEGMMLAASVRYVYGTGADAPGFGLAPRAELSTTIAQHLQALNGRFATYLGGTPLPTQVPPPGAAGPAAANDLRALARAGAAGIGPDSLARISTIGVGDVEVGARVLLLDLGRPPRDSTLAGAQLPGMRIRVVAGALARLGTGTPAIDDELFSVGSGDGQTDAEASIAMDVDHGSRVGGSLAARYTAQLGSVTATRLPDARGFMSPFDAAGVGTRTLGNILSADASVRYRIASALFVSGHYALIAHGGDRYSFPRTGVEDAPLLPGIAPLPESARAGGYREGRAGAGVTYSTVADWERGRARLPIEVSYSHMETVSGSSALVPRAGRDQVTLRVYYRLRR